MPLTHAAWPAFLEKLWAKAMGNYEQISAGDTTDAFDFLVNAPSKLYKIKEDNITAEVGWQLISEADKKQYILAANTAAGSDQEQGVLGLPKGHAFTLIGANELKDADGNVVYRLYKIRNPWGVDLGYTGNWRDDDP